MLHIHFQVILQVFAHARQVVHHRDAERLKLGGVAHARKLQELGRVDRAAAANNVAGIGALRRPAPDSIFDPHGALALEQDARGERAGRHRQIGAIDHRVQVGARRAEPPPIMDVAVEGAEAFLAVAVDVFGERVASFLHRREKSPEQGRVGRAALKDQRAVVAAKFVAAVQACFHALEVGQAVRVVPIGHAGVAGPALVVERVAALEDHAVDAAGAAEDFAAPVRDAAIVHEWLGLGVVAPVVEGAADWVGKRRRHVDEDVPERVAAAGFEHQHAVPRVGAQARGQHAAG